MTTDTPTPKKRGGARANAGRPATGRGGDVKIYLPRDILLALKTAAETSGQSMSAIVCEVMTSHFKTSKI